MKSIRVEQLKYKYPGSDHFVLDDISFAVEKGEFIGIAGENGAGKTTLCYALSGLVPHFFKGGYGGNVFIGDMEVYTHAMSELTARVGLVFENPFSQMTGAKFTVYDEIAFGLENLGVPRGEMHRRIQECMKQLKIEELGDVNPFSLSGGQLQRVAIASVMAMKPDILILDEPTSQLDPQGAEEVFQVVEQLSAQGVTIIMAEQKIEKLAAYSDRIFLMNQGKLIHKGTPAEIFSRDDLDVYGIAPPVYTSAARSLKFRQDPTANLPVVLEEMPTSGLEKFSLPTRHVEVVDVKTAEIVVSDLCFGYEKDAEIIKGIDLELSGKPLAIIGQNGAGKTTFVKLLKALLKPHKGKITVVGVKTTDTTAAKLAAAIGLIFQNPNDQIFKSKVIDEVMFGPLNIGQSPETAEANALKMLDRVGLASKKYENPYDLSLAERKLIAVASILAMDTKVIIFDEPTIGQDAKGKVKLAAIINELYAQGKLVVCILHDMDFVAETFERTVILGDGRVLFHGETRAAFGQEELLRDAGLEQPHITQLAHRMGYPGILLRKSELH
ncbi:ABC transporter ATP-binding protein [Sporosarcina sp. BI001-red]|uniref:ABC transporter ATP-binding protein n=1 Tax=Sporosarcina sp. BI001-red TaxID=2282866 RepID=UPI000E221697|nr:ABC transporter ATP-binding protein [Sporosarcina sp. BI001-red]REB11608.1 ABC transporter ATP-binding protein [Sporosarcina sp. BI001-red]